MSAESEMQHKMLARLTAMWTDYLSGNGDDGLTATVFGDPENPDTWLRAEHKIELPSYMVTPDEQMQAALQADLLPLIEEATRDMQAQVEQQAAAAVACVMGWFCQLAGQVRDLVPDAAAISIDEFLQEAARRIED